MERNFLAVSFAHMVDAPKERIIKADSRVKAIENFEEAYPKEMLTSVKEIIALEQCDEEVLTKIPMRPYHAELVMHGILAKAGIPYNPNHKLEPFREGMFFLLS